MGHEALAEYTHPPIAAVDLSVQFDGLSHLRAAHLGVFAEQLVSEGHNFPHLDEHLPIDPVFEHFGGQSQPPTLDFKLLDAPPPPHCILTNKERSTLLHLQADRFTYRWNRRGESSNSYPRYSRLRKAFQGYFVDFANFLELRNLGIPIIRQSEISYINKIEIREDASGDHGIGEVVKMWQPHADSTLPALEDAHFVQRHLLVDNEGEPYARLYITLSSTGETGGGRSLYLTLTVRGRQLGEGLEGSLNFMDAAHDVIVRAFTAVTTDRMHELWGGPK